MGLLGFGLGMLGKAIVKEAIVQGITEQQEAKRLKDIRLSEYRKMFSTDLLDKFFNMILRSPYDVTIDQEFNRLIEAINDRIETTGYKSISMVEIEVNWRVFVEEHKNDMWGQYELMTISSERLSYDDFVYKMKRLDFNKILKSNNAEAWRLWIL
jgi:hypothetical protein